MIDTIILNLPSTYYRITNDDKFTPSTRNIFSDRFGNQPFIKYVQNPLKAEYLAGNYKPRLTITKRMVRGGAIITPIKIEFSCSKMLFNNNFDELTQNDFEQTINKLQNKLKEMGILIEKDHLKQAEVSAVHYSKNIPLTNYLTSSLVLRELMKVNLTKRLDLNQTHFRNEGHAVYYYSKSHSIVFYDKMKDLKIPDGRAVESDNAIQLDLFNKQKQVNPMELLRMEVRLCNKRKIRQVIRDLNFSEDLRFESLFNESISKKILNYYWKNILDNLDLLKFSSLQPIDLFESIVRNNDIQLKTALSHFGALTIINNEGSRKFRQIINESYSDRSYQRINQSLHRLRNPPENKFSIVSNISEALNRFESVKIADLKKKEICDKMITNDIIDKEG